MTHRWRARPQSGRGSVEVVEDLRIVDEDLVAQLDVGDDASQQVEELAFVNFVLPYPVDLLATRIGDNGIGRLARLEALLQRAPGLRRLGWTMIVRARRTR